LLGPIQTKLAVAIELRSIAEQLQNDPELARIFESIKLTSPTDSSTGYQPVDIDRELAELASLLPMNAALASKVLQTQKDCASELRRIRERLQADSALLQQFRTVKMSNVCENFNAFKAFGCLGGSATNQSHSLVREIGTFESFLKAGPQAFVVREVGADEPGVSQSTSEFLRASTSQRRGASIPSQVAASPARLRTRAAQDFMRRFEPKCFYHFTDRRNLPLIQATGGLCSLEELRRRKINPPAPGASADSQLRDFGSGMGAYVHLCFLDRNPMEWVARRDGRIQSSMFLEVDCSILDIDGLLLTSGFANKRGLVPVPLTSALEEFDFEVLYRKPDLSNPDYAARHDRAWRYELLVPGCVPLNLIRNLPSADHAAIDRASEERSYELSKPHDDADFDYDIPY